PFENSIYILQKPARIECMLYFIPTERLLNINIAQYLFLERTALIPYAHGIALDPAIRVLSREIFRDERQKQFPRINEAVRQLKILLHPVRIHDKLLDERRCPVEQVVCKNRRIRKNDPLHRRV